MVEAFRKNPGKNSCATILWPNPKKKWRYSIQNKTCGSAAGNEGCRLHRNHYVHSLITTGMCIEGGNTSAPRDRGYLSTNLLTQIVFDPQIKPPSLPNDTGISYILNVFFFGNLLVSLCFQRGKQGVLTNWGAGQSWYRCGESRLPHNLEPRRNLATFREGPVPIPQLDPQQIPAELPFLIDL